MIGWSALVLSIVLAQEALHESTHRDDLEASLRLIRSGANVNAATDLGVTPLWNACLNGNLALVNALLDKGANPKLALLQGETPLMIAARSGHAAIVERLLVKGAPANARGPRQQTALMWAAAEKRAGVVRVLLAHGAEFRLKSSEWSQMMAVPPHGYPGYNKMIPHGGQTALVFAARVGDLESARMLVAAGASVNDADAWGVTATGYAAFGGSTELVEFLLDHQADANLAEAGFAPLHCAIARRDERMVKALLEHGANPNLPLKTWTPVRRSARDFHFAPELVGASPFWLAARFLAPGVMRMLLERGAEARFAHRARAIRDKDFAERFQTTTALMAAVGMGSGSAWVPVPRAQREAVALEAVEIALAAGVDPGGKDESGQTALDAAKAAGYGSVVALLAPR